MIDGFRSHRVHRSWLLVLGVLAAGMAVLANPLMGQDDPPPLTSDFEPDPLNFGGRIFISNPDRYPTCPGDFHLRPTYRRELDLDGETDLYIYVQSSDDTLLHVSTPMASYCGDDELGTDALVHVPADPYNDVIEIWVGSHDQPRQVPFTLHISRKDPRVGGH